MNAALSHVTALPVSFDQYIQLGWTLTAIAPNSKGPKTPNWNKRENVFTDSSKIPPGHGVGICHAYSSTMALDIDDFATSEDYLAKKGISLQALLDAPDCVQIESGNPGHAKILYAMPFGLALNSKKLIYTTADNQRKNFLDFRCATSNGLTVQDILPPSVHPVTQRPYQWAGNGHWSKLPQIPAELLNLWQSLLAEDNVRSIKTNTTIDASWDEIKSALEHINPNCDRDQWVQYMMAIHHAGQQTGQDDQAFALFDEWSSQSPTKYKGQQDIMNSWRGLKSDGGITLGTLFHTAMSNGWHRPAPDVASMFSPTVRTADPKAIMDALHVPAPSPDMTLIPDILVRRSTELSKSMGCDPLISIWAGLGAVCAVADARIRLELLPGFRVPPLLWLMTIGNPAAKKTPGADPMLEILKTIELEDRAAYAARKLLFEGADAAYAASKKNYLESSRDPARLLSVEFSQEDLPSVMAQPVPPVPLRLTVSDVTSQKLIRMCADRPEGMLCHLDEMKSWADKMVNRNSPEAQSTWTSAYNCRSETMDRVGDGKTDGNTMAENFACAIFGNMQPRVFGKNMRALSDDGLIQRFVPAILRDSMSDKKGTPIPAMLTSQAEYDLMIRRIFALSPQTYQMSDEAYHLYRDFQDWYHEIAKAERTIGADWSYMTALGKLEGTCGRWILIYHLIENPMETKVSGETTFKAIEFIKTYVLNAMRYAYGEIGGTATDSIEHAVAEFVIQHSTVSATVSVSDIRRSMRRRLDDLSPHHAQQLIRDAMSLLESYEWVKMHADNQKSTSWLINPNLAIQHAGYRQEVLDAKQRMADTIHYTSGGKVPRVIVKGNTLE